jgi:hypothetical protein
VVASCVPSSGHWEHARYLHMLHCCCAHTESEVHGCSGWCLAFISLSSTLGKVAPRWIYSSCSTACYFIRVELACASVGAERLGFVDACCAQSVLCQHRGSAPSLRRCTPLGDSLLLTSCKHGWCPDDRHQSGIRCLVSGLNCCCVEKSHTWRQSKACVRWHSNQQLHPAVL